MKSNLKPLIRFENYKEEWKVSLLSDLATFSKGSGYSKGDLVEAGHPILLYGQLYTNYKTIITFVNNYVNQKEKSVLSIGDEIVVPASGETSEEIARASAITIPNIIIGGDLNIIRPIEKINSIFLALSLSHGETHNDLKKMAQGKSVVHLHNSAIKKIRLKFPSVKEQIEIGLFFKGLDDLISLHHEEIDALKKTKQGFLQKMFPKDGESIPEIRFSEFTNDWTYNKLEEISKVTLGQSPNGQNYTDNPNDYILVQGNADIKKGRVHPRVWTTQVTKTANPGDIILCIRAPVGDVAKTSHKVVLGRGVASIEGNEFLYHLLYKMKKGGYWARYSTGSTFESINSTDIKEAVVMLPSEEEQIKIGEFFRQLDEVIELKEQELEALKQTKKGFLQKMFI